MRDDQSGDPSAPNRRGRLSVEQADAMLQKLRTYRVRPPRAQPITADIERIQRDADKVRSQLGPAIESWLAVVPEPIRSRSRVVALRGGILTVQVDSAAVRYELDGMLRANLLARLRKMLRGPLNRIKIQVGPVSPSK